MNKTFETNVSNLDDLEESKNANDFKLIIPLC